MTSELSSCSFGEEYSREEPSREVSPRERIVAYGPSVLSDSELLALIIGTGRCGENALALAERALVQFGSLRALAEAHPSEVMILRGIGAAKAARIFAAVEMGRRICGRRWKLGEPFKSSSQVFDHYHYALRDQKSEVFFAAYLDARKASPSAPARRNPRPKPPWPAGSVPRIAYRDPLRGPSCLAAST